MGSPAMQDLENGVLYDFDEDEHEELCGSAAGDWYRARFAKAMFGSDEVVAAAIADFPAFRQPGLYFIVVRDMVCYVGQAGDIAERVQAHLKEGRPIGKLAVILGIPKWAQDAIEHAYIHAWSPPWNVEKMRSGYLSRLPELADAAAKLDKSKVAQSYVPTVTASQARWPQWRLWCAGYLQAHPQQPAA